MHRVPQLVSHGAYVVIFAVVVQQNVRMHVVDGSIGIGAPYFAFAWIHIHPPFSKCAACHAYIVFPQWCQRGKY